MFITNNHVIRDGIKKSIDVRNIVVGDIIELEAGDYVSADARIISSEFLLLIIGNILLFFNSSIKFMPIVYPFFKIYYIIK